MICAVNPVLQHQINYDFPKSLKRNVWLPKIMTLSDDCLCGRSQHLTFAESNEKIVIDKKTFKQLLVLLGWCTNELIKSRFRDCDNFWIFLTYYAKLTIKMPSKQASIFVIIEISKAIRRTFY